MFGNYSDKIENNSHPYALVTDNHGSNHLHWEIRCMDLLQEPQQPFKKPCFFLSLTAKILNRIYNPVAFGSKINSALIRYCPDDTLTYPIGEMKTDLGGLVANDQCINPCHAE